MMYNNFTALHPIEKEKTLAITKLIIIINVFQSKIISYQVFQIKIY